LIPKPRYRKGRDVDNAEIPLSARSYQQRRAATNLEWRSQGTFLVPPIVEEARSRLSSGESVDGVLSFLRANGANSIDAVLALKELLSISTREAQNILHDSEAWHELRGR
jgi:hypothetical protein